MTDASAWQRAADPSRRIGHAIEFHASIGSTNDRARQALELPGGEGLAIVADLQTAGRGRRGRSWQSPPGVNLMASVGIRPRLDPAAAGLLGIAAAVAVHEACVASAPHARLGLRWPNDVVAAIDGAKVAGLLVETALEDGRMTQAIIGVGINANWARSQMPPEIGIRATSLVDLAGGPVDRVALLDALLGALDRQLGRLEDGISPVHRFRSLSALDGRRVTIDLDGELVDGTVAGIADDGALLLDSEAGRMAMSMGEVVAVRDADREGAPA